MGIFIIQKQDEHIQKRPPWQEVVFRIAENFGRLSPQGGDLVQKMIELAKRRRSQYAKQIEFCVADATNRESLLGLKRNRAFTKAVSNMAIMDITDIEPLLMAVYELLQESEIGRAHV